MTDTKRLSLHGRLRMAAACPDPNASLLAEAADAIEQHEALEAENERLREALAQIRDRKWNTMAQGCDAACEAAQIARAALGEK